MFAHCADLRNVWQKLFKVGGEKLLFKNTYFTMNTNIIPTKDESKDDPKLFKFDDFEVELSLLS